MRISDFDALNVEKNVASATTSVFPIGPNRVVASSTQAVDGIAAPVFAVLVAPPLAPASINRTYIFPSPPGLFFSCGCCRRLARRHFLRAHLASCTLASALSARKHSKSPQRQALTRTPRCRGQPFPPSLPKQRFRRRRRRQPFLSVSSAPADQPHLFTTATLRTQSCLGHILRPHGPGLRFSDTC